MSKKLKLNQLKLTSFTTTVKTNEVKGGYFTFFCPTVADVTCQPLCEVTGDC